MCWTGLLSIIRSLVPYTQRDQDGTEFHPDPAREQSAKPVWHIPTAVYTVLGSWWWTENLSETCSVLFQK